MKLLTVAELDSFINGKVCYRCNKNSHLIFKILKKGGKIVILLVTIEVLLIENCNLRYSVSLKLQLFS